MKQKNVNELDSKFLGVCALNPFHQHTSASRIQMFSQHLGQCLPIIGATERVIQTGLEREYAKYTFKVEMPVDGVILEIIERYPRSVVSTIEQNSQTVVIYENIHTKEIGIINLVDFCTNHQYFGFKYVAKPGLNLLRVGAHIPAGTVFLDSPSVTDEGGYKYGVQANIAYMTDPATSEDGVKVSDTFLEKLKFRIYENRVVSWGKNKYALNLYGDENNYKPFPDLGETIRSDGLLMATRPYEPSLAIVERNINALRNVDYAFDTTVYANGPGGKVVDIKINHDLNNFNHATSHHDEQVQKYDRYNRAFYKKISDCYYRYQKQLGNSLQISREFHSLLVIAESVLSESDKSKPKVTKLLRKEPIDAYRVEFVIEYLITPSYGFKLTGMAGDKGVICQIVPEADMPVDENGNRADVVMDSISTINRANPSRLFEQYISGSARDTHLRLCKLLDIPTFTKKSVAYEHIIKSNPALVKQAWDTLMMFYEIVSPVQASWFKDGLIEASNEDYLADIVHLGITPFIPTNNQPETQDIIMALESNPFYRPVYGKVKFRGNSGEWRTSKNNIRIAPVYMMLLEKIGDDAGGVSSSKLQHFGILSQLTKYDKFSKPARLQSTRIFGDAEVRNMASYIGPEFVAEQIDRNNNPITHKAVLRKLFHSDTPSNIESLVNRNEIPYGGSKPLQLNIHILQCAGIEYAYKPYNQEIKYTLKGTSNE